MINYSIYKNTKTDFTKGVMELVGKIELSNIVRLVFFIYAKDNEDYINKKNICKKSIGDKYKELVLLTSVIAQKPLDCNIALEVQRIQGANWEITYKEHYVLAENKDLKYLFASNLIGAIDTDIYTQSESAFSQISNILRQENLNYNNIVRQWNYIEKILLCENGHQHYQNFNDVRSTYYDNINWNNGYPAATGIGMQQGGVIIEFDAVETKNTNYSIKTIDNALQKAAHIYSENVLVGEKTIKSTPKFERAKAILNKNEMLVYISGTASIRGEESVDVYNITNQTQVTMENIEHLISSSTLKEFGIEHNIPNTSLKALRVYIKDENDLIDIKKYMDKYYHTIPTLYLLSNVCREELLIEVEGIIS